MCENGICAGGGPSSLNWCRYILWFRCSSSMCRQFHAFAGVGRAKVLVDPDAIVGGEVSVEASP